MGEVRLTTDFLRRAHRAAAKHAHAQRQLGWAMTDRYGCTHSDVDCDGLIDILDMGGGQAPTLAQCDALMLECGVAPLKAKDPRHD